MARRFSNSIVIEETESDSENAVPSMNTKKDKKEPVKAKRRIVDLSYRHYPPVRVDCNKYKKQSSTPKWKPIVYQTEEFRAMNHDARVKALNEFHRINAEKLSDVASRQLDCVPAPEALTQIFKGNEPGTGNSPKLYSFSNSFKGASSSDVPKQNEDSEYVSRFGRITKRKIYSECPETQVTKLRKTGIDKIGEGIPILENEGTERKETFEMFESTLSLEDDLKGVVKESPSTLKNFDQKKGKTAASSNKVQCPICWRSFIAKEIEGHAATCGENKIATRSFSSITCLYCDQVLCDEKEREEHQKKCEMKHEK